MSYSGPVRAQASEPSKTAAAVVSSGGMSREGARSWWLPLVFAVLCLVSANASAKDRVSVLADRLASHDDFRVRTQAALALGASKSKRAVNPLCKGLADSNTTVRAASAAALGKLRKGGSKCLKKRLGAESSSTVKSVIKKSLARLESGAGSGGGAAPAISDSSKYYISIGKTADKTGRNVDGMVREAMTEAAQNLGGYVVAPKGESAGQAKKVLSKHKQLTAFYLSPKVQKPKYNGGDLTVRVEIAIFTYPGKALKGMIPVNLTMQGVSEGDTDSEDELIRMAAGRALEKFAQNAERIQ